MQQPPELTDPVGPLVHERLSVRHKQSDLALGSGERRNRQVGVGQSGPGDRLGIDRVGFATHPVGPAGLTHELRRDPD